MNFQENGIDVSRKIFETCGNPNLGRRRRSSSEVRSIPLSAAKKEIAYESLNFPSGKRKPNKKTEAVPTLERLIRDIKQKVKETRQFWNYLPIQYCNNDKIAPTSASEEPCWNGTHLGHYETPSVPTSVQRTSPVLHEQIYTLQVWTGKLQSAYQGQEVDLADDSEETLMGSGSGSGDDSDQRSSFEDDIEIDTSTERKITTSTTRHPFVQQTSSTTMPSLEKALASYLLPIVLVWFGGAITDLTSVITRPFMV